MIVPFDKLIEELSRFPGVGGKSARRMAMHILSSDNGAVRQLITTIVQAKEQIKHCEECGALSTDAKCSVCANPSRDKSIICVVKDPFDVISLENSRSFNGLYHVLHGELDPMSNRGVDSIDFRKLVTRCAKDEVKEIILATSTTTQGDATATYISNLLVDFHLNITRIGHGIPVGGALDYADEMTLFKAITNRTRM